MTEWIRHPLYAGVLAVTWMVLQRRLMLADLAIGYVVALVVVWVCRDFWTERVRIRRPLGMLRLLVVFLTRDRGREPPGGVDHRAADGCPSGRR